MAWEDIIKKSKLIKMDDSMSFFLAVEIDVDYDRMPFPKGRPFDENPYQEIADRDLESELHRELADEIESQLKGQDFSIQTVIEEQDDDGNELEATIGIKGTITGVSANR